MRPSVPETPWHIGDIMRMLPHRYPMLFVDRVEKIERGTDPNNWIGRKAVCYKNITMNEQFFTGHFPHRPIMPGVIQIEALAQACILCVWEPAPEGKRYEFLIGGIDNARFRRAVVPGDCFEMRVELKKHRRTIMVFDCKGYVDGELAVETEILAHMIPVNIEAGA